MRSIFGIKNYFYTYMIIIIFTLITFFATLFIHNFFHNLLLLDEKLLPVSEAHKKYKYEVKTKVLKQQLQPDYGKLAFLTFDDGPNIYTASILHKLKEHEAQATFFLLQENIKKHPTIANDIITAGHNVGCHGVSHTIHTFYSSSVNAVNEMKKCQEQLFFTTRKYSNLIRLPYGSYPNLTFEMKKALEDADFIYWDWNIDTMDWASPNNSSTIKNFRNQLDKQKNKNVTILMHDHRSTPEYLPLLIAELRTRGYTLATITEQMEPVQFKIKQN